MSSGELMKNVLKHRPEADKRVASILKKCQRIGVKTNEISSLLETHDKNCQKFTKKEAKILKCLISSALVVAFLLTISYLNFHFNPDDQCWLDMPSMITKATRPPEHCSLCSDVSSVRRVANLTPDEFENDYAYSGIPVVVTDATTSWTALKVFDFWFFHKVYRETDLGNAARDCQFFPYKTDFDSLQDALQMDEERANLTLGTKPWYIGWSNCHDKAARLLRQHYSRPYFLPESAENNAVDWIFMGGPGDGAQMHVDNVVHPSWQAQLKGRKRWQLAPPPECLYSCSSMEVTVNPGEIIVLDTNRWYHKTEVLPGEISITIGAEYD